MGFDISKDTCAILTIPSGAEIANRFIAFSLFVKSNNRNDFIQYEITTFLIIRFDTDA